MKVAKLHKVEAQARTPVLAECRLAYGMLDRTVGLLTRSSLGENEGLLLRPCKQVHTLFMRFAIDAVFLDRDFVIVAVEELSPWRLSKFHWKASSVLEMAAGAAARKSLAPGDRLELETCSS